MSRQGTEDVPADVMRTDNNVHAPIRLRAPRATDAAAMWALVRDSGALDLNSPYAYLLICTDHAATSLVAVRDGDLVGFVAAYQPPQEPGVIFVWQVGVVPEARGQGLARRLVLGVLACDANRDARELRATVTPDNAASLALFRGIARDLGVGIAEHERFGPELFPDPTQQAPENELRVGPLPALAPAGDAASSISERL